MITTTCHKVASAMLLDPSSIQSKERMDGKRSTEEVISPQEKVEVLKVDVPMPFGLDELQGFIADEWEEVVKTG